MIDPTGRLIVTVRDNPGVAALTVRVGSHRRPTWVGPMAIVRRLSSTPWAGFSGADKVGLQTVRYSVLCYGPKTEGDDETTQGGERQAFQLAGAVHDALHYAGVIKYTAPGGSGHAVTFRIKEESTGSAIKDPITDEPYVPVVVSLTALAQAIA